MAKPAELIEAKIKALLAYCHSRKRSHQEQQRIENDIRDKYSRCYEDKVQKIVLPKKIYKSKSWLSRLLTQESTPNLSLRSYLQYNHEPVQLSAQKDLYFSPQSHNRLANFDSPTQLHRLQTSGGLSANASGRKTEGSQSSPNNPFHSWQTPKQATQQSPEGGFDSAKRQKSFHVPVDLSFAMPSKKHTDQKTRAFSYSSEEDLVFVPPTPYFPGASGLKAPRVVLDVETINLESPAAERKDSASLAPGAVLLNLDDDMDWGHAPQPENKGFDIHTWVGESPGAGGHPPANLDTGSDDELPLLRPLSPDLSADGWSSNHLRRSDEGKRTLHDSGDTTDTLKNNQSTAGVHTSVFQPEGAMSALGLQEAWGARAKPTFGGPQGFRDDRPDSWLGPTDNRGKRRVYGSPEGRRFN